MTSGKFIRFQTPSQMEPESLEAIFVQRKRLAERLVDKIVDSAKTASKHHALLVGPRGIGKTHLVSLVYNRVYNRVHNRDLAQEEVQGRLVVAWLREDAYSVASYVHLLLAILKALSESDSGFDEDLALDQLYGAEEGLREARAEDMLLSAIGDRTLLLITENLGDTFEAIGSEGQQKLRALVQNHPRFTILATTQSLFGGVQLRTSPFYGFFEIHHLNRFSFEEALEMLRKIAEFKGDTELAGLLRSPKGRARVRAVDHLAAGSPRIYVILSEFLGAESIDELVEPVLKMIENLTPYYQSRMQLISPQQRALVEYLCEREAAITVADISRGVLLTSQTASSQLRKLQDLGYVRRHPEGRKSYYELQEPLMRIALSAKKQRGKPFRLFVEFLRCWFTESELSVRAKANAVSAAPLDSQYAHAALELLRTAGVDPRLEASARDYRRLTESRDYTRALAAAEEVVELRGAPSDWIAKGATEIEIGQFEEALASSEKAVELNAEDGDAWRNRGLALGRLGRHEEALGSFDKALELNTEDAAAWSNRGFALGSLGRHEEALGSYDKALELNTEDGLAWRNQGLALGRLGRHEEALGSFDKALELNAEDGDAWRNRGFALGSLGRHEEALGSFDKALELNAEDGDAWRNRGDALLSLGRHEEALGSYDKALELNAEDGDAWHNRGDALGSLGQHEEALGSFDKALELNTEDATAWSNRGFALGSLGRHEEALGSYDKALELNTEDGLAWRNQGLALGRLGRHEEALGSFDKALELNAEDGVAWRNRGEALGYLGRHEEALVSLDKATNLKPEAIEPAVLHSQLRVRLGSISAAEKQIRALADRHPADAVAAQLVHTIPTLRFPEFGEPARRQWVRICKDAFGDREEYDTALRLLEAASDYLNSGDPAALFALPAEERSIVAPLVGWPHDEAKRGTSSERG